MSTNSSGHVDSLQACGRSPERVCNDCGAIDYPTSFIPTCPEKKLIDAEGVCYICASWRVRIAKKNDTVIDGHIYSVGDIRKPPNSPHSGMAGRRFEIEYFDGRHVITHDLWSGSKVPDRYRHLIPNTAQFSGGARKFQVGETTGWNPSYRPAPAPQEPHASQETARLASQEAPK